jgi:riboflavin synthase
MKIGIVDTTFSRVDMGGIAVSELESHYPKLEYERRTVPGIKDLAVECKRMLEGDGRAGPGNRKPETRNRARGAGCDIVLALGMVGGAPIDAQCAHEASLGIQQAKLMTNKHIIEVFVHENEAWGGKEFAAICDNRERKHVHNAVALATKPEALTLKAGLGIRQGKDDEGAVREDKGITLGIVVSRFNGEITQKMRMEAERAAKSGGADIVVLEVPGVYDIPIAVKKLLMDKRIDGVVTLGAVVKGGTSHDEVITKDSAKRIGELSLEFRKPVTLGVIGHNADWDGAGKRAGDYARRAAEAAIYMANLLRETA